VSTKPNHRRGESRKQDNGSRWEGEPNDGGAGVREARRNWRRLRARAERHTGKTSGKFFGSPRVRPDGGEDEEG
jgi:hypothetical protein